MTAGLFRRSIISVNAAPLLFLILPSRAICFTMLSAISPTFLHPRQFGTAETKSRPLATISPQMTSTIAR